MPKGRILNKVLAAFLVFTLLFSNVAFVSKSLASSIFDGLFGADDGTGQLDVMILAVLTLFQYIQFLVLRIDDPFALCLIQRHRRLIGLRGCHIELDRFAHLGDQLIGTLDLIGHVQKQDHRDDGIDQYQYKGNHRQQTFLHGICLSIVAFSLP